MEALRRVTGLPFSSSPSIPEVPSPENQPFISEPAPAEVAIAGPTSAPKTGPKSSIAEEFPESILKHIRLGDIEKIREHLDRNHNAPLNAINVFGETALKMAVRAKRPEIAVLLVNSNTKCMKEALEILNEGEIDVEMRGKLFECVHPQFPLHEAAVGDDSTLVQTLLETGHDPAELNADNLTSLHCAAYAGRQENMAKILDVSRGVLTIMDPGYTPLHSACAAKLDQSQCVRMLLNYGGVADVKDDKGQTPLHYASSRGHRETIRLLLSFGAHLEERDDLGHTPLSLASSAGHYICVLLLLERGASADIKLVSGETIIDIADSSVRGILQDVLHPNEVIEKGRTPLHIAAERGSIQHIKILLKVGSDPFLKDESGLTALHLASYHDSPQAVEVFLKHDRKLINIKDNDNQTACHIAMNQELEDVFSILTRYLQDGDCLNDKKQSLLHLAARDGRDPFLKIFIAESADPSEEINKQDGNEDTALHHAVVNNRLSTVYCLLEHGPDANLRNKSGETCLHKVMHKLKRRVDKDYLELLHLLVDGGADSAVVNNEGRSSLDMVSDVIPDERIHVLAALYSQPPGHDIMPDDVWYRASAENSRDLLRLIRTRDLKAPPHTDCQYWPMGTTSAAEAQAHHAKPGVYRMSSNPRGHAIILNITEFINKPDKTRNNTELEQQNLQRLFTQLGFKVNVWTNETAKGLKKKIREESRHREHASSDAFVFVLMSHGSQNAILTHDNKYLDFNLEIIKPFTGDACPALRGKPKVFLVQACRSDGAKSLPAATPPGVAFDGSSTFQDRAAPDDAHPMTDLLVVFSTYEGYKAIRTDSSWFIQEFILMCELFAHLDDLEAIARMANDLLNHRKAALHGIFQTAEVRSTLRKKLYLNPGYST